MLRMQVALDEHTKNKILGEIKLRLGSTPRLMDSPIHLSDLTRCITQTYWRRNIATLNAYTPETTANSIDDRGALLGRTAAPRLPHIVTQVETCSRLYSTCGSIALYVRTAPDPAQADSAHSGCAAPQRQGCWRYCWCWPEAGTC